METIIKIDLRTKAAKSFLEYVKTLSFAKVEESEKEKTEWFIQFTKTPLP